MLDYQRVMWLSKGNNNKKPSEINKKQGEEIINNSIFPGNNSYLT
jgi:hypothetical protein